VEATGASAFESAAAGFLEAGLKLFEAFAGSAPQQALPGASAAPTARALVGMFRRDPQTNRPEIALPLPPEITEERLTRAFAALANRLTASAAGGA
jgi:hypothetical protein